MDKLAPALFAFVTLAAAARAQAPAEEVNLLAIGEGALFAVEPQSYSSWPPIYLLDDSPTSGWAGVEGALSGQVFVVELPGTSTVERLEFDTSCIDGAGRGAKSVKVSVSSTSAQGEFTPILAADLADRSAEQRFPAKTRVPARFVRLEIGGNHGDPQWVELCTFRAFGKPVAKAPAADISGTYETDYSLFHVKQQGSALVGCYEHDEGTLTGTVVGRVMKITWQEAGGPTDNGPAVMIFAPDGKSFRGWWWGNVSAEAPPSGEWNGTKRSDQVGGCPHWSGSVGGEVERELASARRARVYGIEFDTDSATLRPESVTVLEDVVRALVAHADWQLEIEGHTDSTGGAAHNQKLSEARAAAVRDWLAAHGIAAAKLTSRGFGADQPVGDNATALGRARNRRVEIVRR